MRHTEGIRRHVRLRRGRRGVYFYLSFFLFTYGQLD